MTEEEINQAINLLQKILYYLRKEKYGESNTSKKEGQKKQTTDQI